VTPAGMPADEKSWFGKLKDRILGPATAGRRRGTRRGSRRTRRRGGMDTAPKSFDFGAPKPLAPFAPPASFPPAAPAVSDKKPLAPIVPPDAPKNAGRRRKSRRGARKH
jgi:hypothetical protein